MKPRVLVVDDDPYLADVVATALRYEGFVVATAGSADQARAKLPAFGADLVILDVMLPGDSGLQACVRLRADGWDVPVMFLTARDAVPDKVAGLSAGGDDYLTKPFSIAELVARVRAILRRTGQRGQSRLIVGDLDIDEAAREVRRAGHLVTLRPTEYDLLRYLALNAGRVLTKRQIIDQVWPDRTDGHEGVLHTYVSYVRGKVDAHGEPLIHTVPRVGYVLRATA